MENLIAIGIVVVVILAGVYFIPKLKSKGIITDDNTQDAKTALEFAKLIIDVLDIKEEQKQKLLTAQEIAYTVIDYIENIDDDTVDKKDLIGDTISEVLKELGITPTPQEQKLIDAAVEEALKRLGNQ